MRKRALFVLPVLAVAAAGVFGYYIMAVVLRQEPPRADTGPRTLSVTFRAVAAEDVAVRLAGFGTVRARDRVAVSPEITGRVTAVAPALETGRTVAAGAELFSFDRRPFTLARDDAQAQVDGLFARIAELEAARKADTARLEVLRESRQLADKEYDRVKRLFTREDVGSEAEVEAARRAALREHDLLLNLEKALSLYDTQLKAARSSLAAARARLGMAELDLERTAVTAPVAGRIDHVSVEAGQVVRAGTAVVTIEAAGTLEVAVPLEGRDLLWLPEAPEAGRMPPVPAVLTWIQGAVSWPGTLSHVEKYEAATRSAVIVVNLDPAADGTVPPRAGMFCRVALDGKVAAGVYRVPRDVVRADGSVAVFVPEEAASSPARGRLTYKTVEVVTWQGEEALVGSGLAAGDRVIVSPLGDAVEGDLLEGEAQ
jgi:RND family efflux transporter MFP subunit